MKTTRSVSKLILILLAGLIACKHQNCLAEEKKSVSNSIPGGGALGQSFGKLPTFIKSDSLSLQSEARTFNYLGNVEVAQGDMILTADRLDGKYDENNKIQEMTARGHVLITKGPTVRATGEKAIYEAASETVVLTDNPELQQDGSILSADRIRVFLNDNKSVAEGTVRVKLIQKDQANISLSQAVDGSK